MLFDPLELSYSKIRAYMECPRMYWYVYVQQKRVPLTAEASLGLSVHKALEAYHKAGGEPEDLLEYYDANWFNQGFKSPQEQAEFYDKGRNMLVRYLDVDRDRKSRIVHVEKEFEFPLEKWRVRGTMDRVDSHPDGTWEIIDYKTGAQIKSREQMADSLQMGIYGIGMKRALGLEPDKITFWFLAQMKRVAFPYDPSREENVISTFKSVGLKILKEEFPPNAANCPFCSLKKWCEFSVIK